MRTARCSIATRCRPPARCRWRGVEIGADLVSLSAHKLGGPPGVGALVVTGRPSCGGDPRRRSGTRSPRRHREPARHRRFRGGGQAAAAGLAEYDRVRRLRDRLEAAALAAVPQARAIGADVPRLPNTSALALPGVPAETQIIALDLDGVMVSAGAACSSGKVGPSHVLAAMGLPPDIAAAAIRISLGWSDNGGRYRPFPRCLDRPGAPLLAESGMMERPNNLPIYLDNQASTPLDPRVLEAMLPYFTEHFGNPHSESHVYGKTAMAAIEVARADVAALIGADPREIVFTSGATEANNLALKGAAHFARTHPATGVTPRDRIVVLTTEHKCVLESAAALAREGFDGDAPAGRAERPRPLDHLAAALDERTLLVSIMAAHNEIGVIQPLGRDRRPVPRSAACCSTPTRRRPSARCRSTSRR